MTRCADFEEWLERQDIPVEETTEVESYKAYVAEEYGISYDTQTPTVEKVYEAKYEVFPRLGITPVERDYMYRGEPYTETRYAIQGLRGLYGPASAARIAAERLEAGAEIELAETYWARYQQRVEQGPQRRRRGAEE